MKNFMLLAFNILILSSASLSQTSNQNLNFCKQYFRAEGLIQLALKYKNVGLNVTLLDEASKAATRAETTLTEMEPSLTKKLTVQEVGDLKSSIKFIKERASEELDDNSVMKITLWLQLSEKKLTPIFLKIMK